MSRIVRGVAADPIEERLALYRSLFAYARRRELDLVRFWLDPLAALPFRLGESLAEAKVPYAFDDAFDRLAGGAVADLLELLKRRFSPAETRDLGRFDLEDRRPIKEESYSPRFTPPGSLEYRLAARAPRLDPHLDCGLVDSWTTRGGPGARLLAGLRDVFGRALDAEIESRGEVPYAYLAALAVADVLDEKKALVKSVSLRGVSYERLEKAVGIGLFLAVETAAMAALAPYRRRRLAVDLTHTSLLVESALNPILYVSIKSRALQNDVNPWSLPPEATGLLDEVYEEVLLHDPDPPTLETRFGEAVRGRDDARVAAARIGVAREARRRIHAFLAHFDDGRTDWMRLLVSVVRRDADLNALLGRSRAREALRSRVQAFGRQGRHDEAGKAAHADLLELLDAYADGDPALRAVRGLPAPEEFAGRGVGAFLAYTFDRFGGTRLDEARGHLHHAREPGASPAALVERYAAGRLYRFSADGKHLLKPMRRALQGQLFVDLKGFTRRTYRAKEVVMADFMREQFYGPILEAAKRRFAALAYGGGGERPIELHNLLGDAAAFAGSVSDLVHLARDLQRIGREYETRLRSAAPSLAAEASLRQLEEQHRDAEAEDGRELDAVVLEAEMLKGEIARKQALPLAEKERLLAAFFEDRFHEFDRLREETLARLREGGEDARALEGYLERLAGWEAELRWKEQRTREALAGLDEAERSPRLTDLLCRKEHGRIQALEARARELRARQALRRRTLEERRRAVLGFGLETGIYVSYGASAEVITLDDEVFGSLRVAISEKINEAARGTARNQEIKRKMDADLDRSRRERGRPDLAWPFEVYVESAQSLVMPQEVSVAIERAFGAKDPALADEAAALLARLAREDLVSAAREGGKRSRMVQTFSDIHNLGVALSGEALDAFLAETLAARYHFEKSLPVSELHPELQAAFVFREPTLSFVVSVPADPQASAAAEALVFHHAGNVQFRGFELKGAGSVYELLSPVTPFYEGLLHHHLPAWIEEAREDPSRLVTRLG